MYTYYIFQLAINRRLKFFIRTPDQNRNIFVCNRCFVPIIWLDMAFDGAITDPFIYCESVQDTYCEFTEGYLFCRGCNIKLSSSPDEPLKIDKSKTDHMSIHEAWQKAFNYIVQRFRIG